MMRRWRPTSSWSRSAPRLRVAALALLLLGLLGWALAPLPGTRHPRRTSVARAARPRATRRAPRRASLVSAPELAQPGAAARSFLDSYLPVAYGRAPASSVLGATSALRAQLSRSRARVTPAERDRHPTVVSVASAAQAPGFVLATAVISDGRVTTYSLRILVQEEARGWVVTECPRSRFSPRI
jgi:hypothetical protein